MTGWVVLAGLALLVLAACWKLKVRGAMLQLVAATLLVGASGYALQGRPGLAGAPRSATGGNSVVPLTGARHAFFGDFARFEHWLLMSESLARRGKTADAAGILRSAVREHPDDVALWVGLGNALVDHSRMLTPAAEFAFSRAAELAPGHPAPVFFYGLALARSGDREAAIALWRRLLSQAPAEAGWRPLVEDAIAALEPRR